MKLIYRKLSIKNVPIEHVCEVGVYLPETSNVGDFIRNGARATLVEADPDTVVKIREAFGAFDVTIHPVAVWDTEGVLQLSKAGSSTFATALPNSPALTNDNYEVQQTNTFEVACRPFSALDDGTIDLLSIDIEGAEWYVLKHLRSKPKVLSIETHGKYYNNPYLPEILAWIAGNDYVLWYRDSSDSVFIRQGLFAPSGSDKLQTLRSDAATGWKKFKRLFKPANKRK